MFYNFISELFERFNNIEIFDISNNHISTIEDFYFKNHTYLEQIRLNDNNLKTVHPYIFEGLVYLEILDLARNEIKVIEKSFGYNLPNLVKLNFSQN